MTQNATLVADSPDAQEPADLPANSVQRSVTLDVFAPEGLRQGVLDSIRRYRAVCRQVYAALLLGQTAGATIEDNTEAGFRLKPQSDAAKIALGAALGAARIERGERVRGEGQEYRVQLGSALAYELRAYVRQELWPSSLSFVWDSIRRDVTTVWTSRDPEHTRVQRGWLALQGARGLAQFNWRGIGFPVATARPKLEGYALGLKWDRDLDQVVFELARLDGGRAYVWKQLRDGAPGWRAGTLYLNERDGRLKATLSYAKPSQSAAVDSARVLTVSWDTADPEILLRISGPDGAATMDLIYAADAAQWLRRQEHRKARYQSAQAACGSPSKPWGSRKGWRANQERIARLTLLRENYVKTINHDWTRRIVTRAVAWRCGAIALPEELPTDLAGLPWKWSQFEELLRYKSTEKGITVTRTGAR